MVPDPGPANNSTPAWGPGPPAAPGGSGWVAAVLCVVIALTAVANSLLIALICTQPALRNTSNFFLVSLFTSDLMVGLVVMPPAMLNALYGRWVLARDLCLLWAAFDVMCCSASILNLCLISLDRYLLILSPLRYKLRMTPPRALALVLGAWSLAALASFLPLLLGWHELGHVRAPALGQCQLLPSLPFVLVASGLTFFLPSGAICFTYCRILLAARRQAVQVTSLTTGVASQALETLQVLGMLPEIWACGMDRNEWPLESRVATLPPSAPPSSSSSWHHGGLMPEIQGEFLSCTHAILDPGPLPHCFSPGSLGRPLLAACFQGCLLCSGARATYKGSNQLLPCSNPHCTQDISGCGLRMWSCGLPPCLPSASLLGCTKQPWRPHAALSRHQAPICANVFALAVPSAWHALPWACSCLTLSSSPVPRMVLTVLSAEPSPCPICSPSNPSLLVVLVILA
uniref:5-hydroxytryptamine receptor 6 n=1 Tax=Marmota marmota marmota TaxID=9994 RepID=A0A8C6A1T0_MARMA